MSGEGRKGVIRAIFIFGHTFGHAIEANIGHGSWMHVEAVAACIAKAAQNACGQIEESNKGSTEVEDSNYR